MVVFTCNNCGESVKKNKVEKHYQTRCRNCPVSVSCMDCNQDFDNSYEKHTKCISEEEKYSAVGFQPKPSANKGETKQEIWMSHVKTVLGRKGLTRDQSHLASKLLKIPNIPRKKKNFQNLIINLGFTVHMGVADQLWDMLEKENTNGKKEAPAPKMPRVDENIKDLKENKDEGIPAIDVNALSKKERKELRKKAKYEAQLQDIKNGLSENTECEAQDEVKEEKTKKKKAKKTGSDENKVGDGNLEEVQHSKGQSKKKGKKRKVEEIEEDVSQSKIKVSKENVNTEDVLENGSCNGKITKFNWHETIVKLLESKSDKELSLKRLRKKVLAEYEALHGQPLPKHIAKFNKTVLRTPGVVVKKEVAKLIAAS